MQSRAEVTVTLSWRSRTGQTFTFPARRRNGMRLSRNTGHIIDLILFRKWYGVISMWMGKCTSRALSGCITCASVDELRLSRLCDDEVLSDLAPVFLETLRYEIGVNVTRCSDLLAKPSDHALCYHHGMSLLRSLCPQTCGCHGASSGLLWTKGCPISCRELNGKSARDAVTDVTGRPARCSDLLPRTTRQNPIQGLFARRQYVVTLFDWWNRSAMGFKAYDEGLRQIFPEFLQKMRCPAPVNAGPAVRMLCGAPNFAFWCPQTCLCEHWCSKQEVRRDTIKHGAGCLPDCNPVCSEIKRG